MEENSVFIRTFGDYPLIRIMDFLIYSRDFDYPITEIASNSNVNFQTLKKLWPKLEQDRIVVSTRTMGGTILYKININNPVVKKLIELNNFLCWEYSEKAEKEQEVAA
jgi:predicted transcriptional regulator